MARHLVVRQHVDEADGVLGHGVVLVVECCQDTRQVTQRGHLVGQLALGAEQTDCCRGNRLQGLALQETTGRSGNVSVGIRAGAADRRNASSTNAILSAESEVSPHKRTTLNMVPNS